VTESRAQIRALGPEECARAVGAMLAARGAAEDGVALALAIAWANEGLSAMELDRVTQVAEGGGIDVGRLDDLIAEGSGPVVSR
jgi:hypothetical protein